MIIENIDIVNKSIRIKGKQVVFLDKGINLITGKNGSGKTTFINYLTRKKEELLGNYSYVSQTHHAYNCSTIDYLFKGEDYDNDLLDKYLGLFSIEHVKDCKNVKTLSGGELTKLTLIREFMKDNNLLILDEPSNHLDDHSTKVLCDLISEKEKRSAIILVSHDRRLLDNLDVNNEIIIKDDKIFNKNEIIDNHQVDLVEINKKPIKKKHFLVNVFNMWAGTMFLLTLIVGSIGVSYMNDYVFQENKAEAGDVKTSDVILTYKVDFGDDSLNKYYLSSKNIKIDSKNKYNYIDESDLKDISKMKYVKKLVLIDQWNEDLETVSLPYFFTDDIKFRSGIAEDDDFEFSLLKGRYPKDDKKEICISKSYLKNYNLNKQRYDLNNIMGKTIEYEGEKYKVCGVLRNNKKYLLSFNSSTEGKGARVYREGMKSFEENELLIYVEKGKEEYVLNGLMKNYPADNYISRVYERVWNQEYERKNLWPKVILYNSIALLINSVLLFIGLYLYKKTSKDIIEDYSNYYGNHTYFYKLFNYMNYAMVIFVGASIVLANYFLREYGRYNTQVIIAYYLILCVIMYIYTMIHDRVVKN